MTLSNFVLGVNILKRYYDNDGDYVSSYGDMIYFYPTSGRMSSKDVQSMVDNGWFQLRSTPSDGILAQFSAGDYDQNLEWCFDVI
jgi:hypothetical protein